MIGLPPNPHDLEGQWFSVRVFFPLGGFYGSPAGVALVWTLTAQTDPAWLNLPGAQGSRRHSPGGRKVAQASPPRQGTPPRGGADELHKPIRRNFPKRRVIVHKVDDTWCSDLVDMQKLSRWNKGYKYLLMMLDLFSKYGWIVPLKTKTGLEVSKAFESIFKKGKPKKLWVDKGKEYYNKNMLDLLAKNNIKIYSTENEEKSSVCERWNRTIKEKMYKRFTMQNNTIYIEILLKILSSYNNSKNRSIGMTPNQARKPQNYGKVYFNLYGDLTESQKSTFKIGDTVRISKYKRKTFDKGYTKSSL